MSTSPPPYSAAVGGNPVQTQPGTQARTQAGVVAFPVVLAATFKLVDNEEPYVEYCPVCQTNVTTKTKYVTGSCWSTIFILALFLFLLPLLFLLCWSGVKDVRHNCPNCGTFLAYKKRNCC